MRPPRFRSRLRGALAALVGLSFTCSVGALLTAVTCHEGRTKSRRFAEAARQAAQVGQLAREQYIHEAHTVIVGDPSHVAHHDVWVDRFHREMRSLRPVLEPTRRDQLDLIAQDSGDVAALFAEQIVPAVNRGDQELVRRAHGAANERVDRMTALADAIATELAAQAIEAEARAERNSWVAAGLAALASVVAFVFGLLIAGRLWSDFARPLSALERVARRVADGDRSARMGVPPLGELVPLARAFDLMLDALAEKEEALRQADRLAAVGRIAAGVAHEMNNPLGVIRGYVKTMQKQKRDPQTDTDLATIDAEAAICQHIVEDLLAHARVPALSRVAVDALELAREASRRLDEAGCRGRIDIDVEPAALVVDPLRLRQVLVNLLRNAIDAAPDERVEILGRKSPDGYSFRVRDRGPGLSSDARSHMFEPFFSTRPGGTGLGLAVSYGLVLAHGGRLSAPAVDVGAEFLVELPGSLWDAKGAA